MNLATHSATGAILGAGIYLQDKHKNHGEITVKGLGFSTLLGFLGGILPDLLERPTSSKHRSFYHSWVFALICIFLLIIVFKFGHLNNEQKVAVKSFSAGYGSHLALDITTPARLPLI